MRPRSSLRDNVRFALLTTGGALLVLLAVELLLRRSRDFSPDFLASVLLYALTVVNLTLLIILAFVLGRNLVRVLLERRRGVLGARFRLRLMLVFLLMAVAPSGLILVVGSDLIQQTVDRWFNVDVERILSSSQGLSTALRESLAERARTDARQLAREIETRGLLDPGGQARLRRTVEVRARELGIPMVSVHAVSGELVAVVDPRLPATSWDAANDEALARAALSGREAEATVPFGAGELVRAAAPVRGAAGPARGAVIVSALLAPQAAAEAREVQERYAKYRKAEAVKEPIKALYISIFLFPALAILFGSVWLSLYLARRITAPLRLVAEGAERIASGERGVRVSFPAGNDEFAALIGSFNRMSERLQRSEEEVAHSRAGLQRKNQELEEGRRLTDTVLETIGTGIVLVDSEGTTLLANAAACSLLDLEPVIAGRRFTEALGPGRGEIAELVQRLLSGRAARQEREVQLVSAGRDRHLAVVVVPLPGTPGAPPGALLVLDDLTPLMRAQKVAAWGEVARRLAHEIKNPLTPIQLSAQRIRKAYLKSAPDLERIVPECTDAIVKEVEALKNLVDEFAQFARLPAVNLAPGSLHEVVEQTLSLYDGFAGVRIERRLAPDLPPVRIDAPQLKRVLINLVDNAIEATGRAGTVTVSTEFDRGHGRVRFAVADDGPGVLPEDRDRLFVPTFSTKRRGSGLGLAIVSRIVQEHRGTIRVEDNAPRGARFVVELPA
jgi:two-component system, NtrC family, nitrogen regulation sensor histidine kinase NtrY